jgi:hypothetical protein
MRHPIVVWAKTPKSHEANAQKTYNTIKDNAIIEMIIFDMILLFKRLKCFSRFGITKVGAICGG